MFPNLMPSLVQIYDTGVLVGPGGTFEVKNVQVYGGYVLHVGSLQDSSCKISVADDILATVDFDRRSLIAPNHTCTHLLNFALKVCFF